MEEGWNKREAIEHALGSSIARLWDAFNSGADQEIFAALGESLYWLVVLEDWWEEHLGAEALAERLKGREGLAQLRGLRWARNCLTHRYGAGWFHHLTVVPGNRFPIRLPKVFGARNAWLWIPASEIPLSRRYDHGRDDYVTELSGKEISVTLGMVQRLFVSLNDRPVKLRD